MASGPYFDPRRGTWSVQWFDGLKWRRPVVVKKSPGWKPGGAPPKKVPPAAMAAVGEYAEMEKAARARSGRSPERTVKDFLASYLDAYRLANAEGSAGEVAKAIRLFTAWCDREEVVKLSQVNSAACHGWLIERAATIVPRTGKPVQYATLSQQRGLLAAAWAQAVKREEIDRNPWVAAPVPGKPTKKARGSWSPEDYRKILDVSRPWLRDVLTLGCHTGLRIFALRNIVWTDLAWAADGEAGYGWVIVRPELDKARKGYRVPMSRTCHDLLARRLAARDAHPTFILTGHLGRKIKTQKTTDEAIRLACSKAGLGNPDSPNHHMRRTFGRWAVLGHLTGKPVPLYVVSRWFGHASVQMTERYLGMTHDDSTRYMVGDDSAETRI